MKTTSRTNAMRLLEQAGLDFIPHGYSVEDGAIDALSVAQKIGLEPGRVFKTLLCVAPGNEYLVFILPGDGTLDFKKAARIAEKKSVEMLPGKQLLPLTGYIHGGCSPVGMKKLFPTWIDENACLYETICVSGGRVGLNLELNPEALAEFLGARFGDLLA